VGLSVARPVVVVEADVVPHEPEQVALAEDDDEIEELASDRPDEPLVEVVLARRARRTPELFEPHAGELLVDGRAPPCREGLKRRRSALEGVGHRYTSTHTAGPRENRSRREDFLEAVRRVQPEAYGTGTWHSSIVW
jgi:hypothetical protein